MYLREMKGMNIDAHLHTFPQKTAASAGDWFKRVSRTIPFCSGTDGGLRASMDIADIDYSVAHPVTINPIKALIINDLSICVIGNTRMICFGALTVLTYNA